MTPDAFVKKTILIIMIALAWLGTWLCVSHGIPAIIFDHFLLFLVANIAVFGGTIWLVCAFAAYVRAAGVFFQGMLLLVMLAMVIVSFALGSSLFWAPQLFHGNIVHSLLALAWAYFVMSSFVRHTSKRLFV